MLLLLAAMVKILALNWQNKSFRIAQKAYFDRFDCPQGYPKWTHSMTADWFKPRIDNNKN